MLGDHPLLQRLVRTSETSRTYVTSFSTADSWIVGDHRIQGHGLVPGTAYLELVRAAVAGQAAGRDIEIGDVLFLVPVIVPDGQTRDVYTTIDERDGRRRFAVQSRTGAAGPRLDRPRARHDHFPERRPDTVRDLGELRRECEMHEVLDTEDDQTRAQAGPVRAGRADPVLVRSALALPAPDRDRRPAADGHPPARRRVPRRPRRLPAAPGAAGRGRRHARIHARDIYYLPFTYRRCASCPR